MKDDGKNAKNVSAGKDSPHPSHSSHPIIPPRGDYQTLLSYQKAEVIYDLTFRFAHKYLAKGDRTVDQMIQSARSGKQNILEGSKAALTSKETELKLTSVGRASLEELLADYRDYLRVRDHATWDKDSKEAQFVRRLGRKTPHTYELYREFVETRPPEVIANIAICLIHQANYLIDQQRRWLASFPFIAWLARPRGAAWEQRAPAPRWTPRARKYWGTSRRCYNKGVADEEARRPLRSLRGWLIQRDVEQKQQHEANLEATAHVRAEDLLKAAEWFRLHQTATEFIKECEQRWRSSQAGELTREQEIGLLWARDTAKALSPFESGKAAMLTAIRQNRSNNILFG